MIDTIVLRVHGVNQQKTDTLTILQQNKDKLENRKKYIKDMTLSKKIRSSLAQEIKQLEYENRHIKNIDNSKILLVPQHFDLYTSIMEYEGKSFTKFEYYNSQKSQISEYTQEEFLSTSTSKVLNGHYLELEKMRMTNGEYVKNQTRKIRGSYRIPSSTSDVNFSINPDGGFIDFNVSIPKYLYLHNLAQFVPQIDSKNKKLLKGNFDDWHTQRHYLHSRLDKFIKRFFQDLYSFFKLDGILPNYDYVEIRRIDLCYNQIFDSKEDSLLYLEHQKKLFKSSSLRYKNTHKPYDTAIAFHTSKHEYFKIYHKGSEYKSSQYGDFAKHSKINKLTVQHVMKIKEQEYLKEHHKNSKDKQYLFDIFNEKNKIIFKKFENDAKGIPFSVNEQFKNNLDDKYNHHLKNKLQDVFNEVYKINPINTKFISDEADKILRYEISISGYSFNNLFKREVFRRHCKTHNHYKKIYSLVKKVEARKESYKYKLTPQDRRDYRMMHDFYNRSSNFTLTDRMDVKRHQKKSSYDYSQNFDSYSIQKSYWLFGLKSVLEEHDSFYFSDIFLKKLVDKFKKKIDYFQLTKIQPYDDLQKKVIEHNKKAKSTVDNYNTMNKFKCFDINKNRRIHKGKEVKYATQLLTESQKRKRGMQRINLANVSLFFNLMHGEQKMSLLEVRKHLKMSPDAFYRRKRSLESLGVYENHLSITKTFNVPINFRNYYYKTKGLVYKKDFYFKPVFSTYG